MERTPNRSYAFLICVVLVLATAAVYWQLRYNDFVSYDDTAYVTENQYVKAGLTRDSITWAFTTNATANWHPLTWLSLMLDCQLFGTNPAWHHSTNLLFHIVNALLLFWVLKGMTGAVWRSGFVAAAFALHPLHVESVAWVAERKDVLSTFFWILMMAAYLGYVKRPAISRYLLALLVFALGLMAKPMLVTLPFVLLLLDYWPLGRFQFGRSVKDAGRQNRKPVDIRSQWQVFCHLVWEKVPFFILSAISSVITFLVQQSMGAVGQIDVLSLKIRIANTFVSYLTYIGKMFWPSRLAVFYPHPGDTVSMWQAGVAALLLLAVSVCVIRLARSHRYLPVGWLWYLGTLIPVIGLVQVGGQALADRYTYVPLTGLFIIIAWGLSALLAKLQYRKIILGTLTVVVLLALSICTRLQVRHWHNSITLFEHALEVTDDNCLMHNNLGVALLQQGKLDQAVTHFTRALKLKSDYHSAHCNLGLALAPQGKLNEAIAHFTEALRIDPDYANAHTGLGMALLQQNKLNAAIMHFTEALRINPDIADVQINMVNALNKLGIALGRQGKFDQAVVNFTEALRINSDIAEVHNNLGYALSQQGKLDEAVIHYTEALRIKPGWTGPMNSLAWLLATHKKTKFHNPEEAFRLAQWACELSNYRNPSLIDTLAAAYAAAGKFSEAVAAAEKALELARSSGQNQLTENIQNRLLLYRTSRPYIEPPIKAPID